VLRVPVLRRRLPGDPRLRVETPAPWRRAVRPAAFAALVVGLFVVGTVLARATGHWKNAISNEEYANRVRTIDSPAYGTPRPRALARGVGAPRPGRLLRPGVAR